MYKPLVSVEITLGPNASPTAGPQVVRMPEVVTSEVCAVVAMSRASPRIARRSRSGFYAVALAVRSACRLGCELRQRKHEQLVADARVQLRRETREAICESRAARADRNVLLAADRVGHGIAVY